MIKTIAKPATSTAPITINRLTSVEEELADRICRQTNGEKILNVCRRLSGIIEDYNWQSGRLDPELRGMLIDELVDKLGMSSEQVICIVELSLDLLFARQTGSYRRSDMDLSFAIATATGEVGDVRVN